MVIRHSHALASRVFSTCKRSETLDEFYNQISRSRSSSMNPEVQDRRQRQRFDDILTRIEDITYGILRDRPLDAVDPVEQVLALAATAK